MTEVTPHLRTIANLVEWVVVGVLLLSLTAWVPVLGFVLAPYVAGGAVGDRAERWPGWVAASASRGLEPVVVRRLDLLGLRPEALSASPSR